MSSTAGSVHFGDYFEITFALIINTRMINPKLVYPKVVYVLVKSTSQRESNREKQSPC